MHGLTLVLDACGSRRTEAVGYEGGACYLTSRAAVTAESVTSRADVTAVTVTSRARHASDGDILAPAHACRPESGAFSGEFGGVRTGADRGQGFGSDLINLN